MSESTIGANLEALRGRIRTVCERAGRNPREITLVCVTKNVVPERILEAYEGGVQDFGENRAQELLEKVGRLPDTIRWHFVGHLQTNKVKAILDKVVLIQSLDRLALADEIEKQAQRLGRKVDVLLEVNTSGEPTKFGFAPTGLLEAVRSIAGGHSSIRIQGLMTVGPLTADASAVRKSFQQLKALRKRCQDAFPGICWDVLSMGMSQDFEIAIEEGSTVLRIGTAVFGPRKG